MTYFNLFFQNYFPDNVRTKIVPKNQIFLVKRSCVEVSDSSGVPRFVSRLIFRKPIGSQADVHVLDNRVDQVLA